MNKIAYHIFYLTSNSIDTMLDNTVIRTHTVFNQNKIVSQEFVPITDLQGISHDRVIHYPYKMIINWNDGTQSTYNVFVGKTNKKAFTHTPNVANNLLEKNHPAKIVILKGSAKQIRTKNVFRNQDIDLRTTDVYYDGVLILNDYYHPTTKSSNVANFGHKY